MSANAPTPLEGGPSTSMKGWAHLTYAVASTLPTRLRQAQRIRGAAARELAKAGRRR